MTLRVVQVAPLIVSLGIVLVLAPSSSGQSGAEALRPCDNCKRLLEQADSCVRRIDRSAAWVGSLSRATNPWLVRMAGIEVTGLLLTVLESYEPAELRPRELLKHARECMVTEEHEARARATELCEELVRSYELDGLGNEAVQSRHARDFLDCLAVVVSVCHFALADLEAEEWWLPVMADRIEVAARLRFLPFDEQGALSAQATEAIQAALAERVVQRCMARDH